MPTDIDRHAETRRSRRPETEREPILKTARADRIHEEGVTVKSGNVVLDGILTVPARARGIVVFAHGSTSSRFSLRNECIAHCLNEQGLSTLLIDMLTGAEQIVDVVSGNLRFDIPLLVERLTSAVDWVGRDECTRRLRVGLLGSGTGAAAALITAVRRPRTVAAIVCRSGRLDLAQEFLHRVRCPTLFIVGAEDPGIEEINSKAKARFRTECRLEVVHGASHLFSEPGKLEEASRLTSTWFRERLAQAG